MTSPDGAARPQPKWFTETNDNHSQWYVERMRELARQGQDLAGEARFMHALLPPSSRVLDAGCGPGRVSGALRDLGHEVVGVDVDPVLVAAAREDFPDIAFVEADLAQPLVELLPEGSFAGAVVPGNVLPFMADGTQLAALGHLAEVIDGPIVVGFRSGRGYSVEQLDADTEAAGLRVDLRLGTWDLRPFTDESDFCISVLRR